MAQLVYKIPVPDEMLEQYIGAFAAFHGYNPENNSESAIEFSRKRLNRFVEESIALYLGSVAAEQARNAALSSAMSAVGEITTVLEIE